MIAVCHFNPPSSNPQRSRSSDNVHDKPRRGGILSSEILDCLALNWPKFRPQLSYPSCPRVPFLCSPLQCFFFLNNQPRNVGETEAYLSYHPTIPNHHHRCSAGTLDLGANIPPSSNVQRAPNCTGMLICCVTTGTEPQLCPCQPKHLHCDMKRSPKGVSPNFL